jgi:hypothetical protein
MYACILDDEHTCNAERCSDERTVEGELTVAGSLRSCLVPKS